LIERVAAATNSGEYAGMSLTVSVLIDLSTRQARTDSLDCRRLSAADGDALD